MAGRCLGELVRKMGDRVLQQIIPILQQGMQVGRHLLGLSAGHSSWVPKHVAALWAMLSAYSNVYRGLQACSCPLA